MLLLCKADVGEWWGWNGDKPNGLGGPWRNEGGGGGKKLTGLVGGEKSMPLAKGCGVSREGGVDRVSLPLDFDDLFVKEDKNEGGNDGDVKDLEGELVWTIEFNDEEEFSSIFIIVLEFDKSIGIDGTGDGSIVWLWLFVGVVADGCEGRVGFSWIEGGGLDEVVLAPLVVGLTLRLEQLSPVSSSTPFLTKVFSPDMELVSSSSFTLVDDDDGAPLPVSVSFSVVDVSSVFDGGASGILNEFDFVAAFAVTVVYVPRRFPLRRIRSAGSLDEWLLFDWEWFAEDEDEDVIEVKR